jgi:hypothetical protein
MERINDYIEDIDIYILVERGNKYKDITEAIEYTFDVSFSDSTVGNHYRNYKEMPEEERNTELEEFYINNDGGEVYFGEEGLVKSFEEEADKVDEDVFESTFKDGEKIINKLADEEELAYIIIDSVTSMLPKSIRDKSVEEDLSVIDNRNFFEKIKDWFLRLFV